MSQSVRDLLDGAIGDDRHGGAMRWHPDGERIWRKRGRPPVPPRRQPWWRRLWNRVWLP